MADAAIARREARRRKILENSQNRLQRIAGKAGEECCRESPVHSPISEYQETVSSEISNSKAPLHNGVLSSSLLSPENFILDPEATTNHNSIINDLASLLPPNVSGNSTSEAVQKPSLMEYSITYKYDIVLLSLVFQFLCNLSMISLENTYFFLPLIIYAGTKMLWYPQQASNSNIGTILMLLKGTSTPHIHTMLNVMQVISAISLDVCVFVFTTICIQAINIFINDNFVA